jgi:hypothetical protein
VAATTKLICAALAALVVCSARGASAQARTAGRADSIGAALEATDTALFGRVIEVQSEERAERAQVRVLETLRGAALPREIHVRADAEVLLEGGGSLERGRTFLLLVAHEGEDLRVPPGLRAAIVPVERVAERDEARSLLRAYLTGGGALDALLRKSVAIASPRLRAGVLEDLSHRLGPDDAPFLLRLAQQRDALQDVRLFAIRGLGGLSTPLPEALADLLRPSEPVAIRQAVVDAHAARGARDVLQRGLEDPSEEVRKVAVDDLAYPEAVALLEKHFDREPVQAVRIAIVRQLGLIGTDESLGAMRRILTRTSDPAIQRAGEPWLDGRR